MKPVRRADCPPGVVYSTDLGDLRKAARSRRDSEPLKAAPQGPATLRLETKGRGGKAMTRVSRLGLDPGHLDRLCRDLKAHCGAGGTIENADILIQGDHREKIAAFLRQRGHQVK
jgi:translation initiation factor 1